MVLGQKVLVSGALLLLCFILVSQDEYRGALPLELLRPKYGEEPRFPRDYVIGELGQGGASEESYRYARLLAASLASGNGTPDGLEFSDAKRLAVRDRLGSLGVRRWRVGGGRAEPDGAVSFLVRFLGREQSITGELYLRRAEPPVEAPAIAETPAAAESAATVPETVDSAASTEAVEAAPDTVATETPAALEAVNTSSAEAPALAAAAAEASPAAVETPAAPEAANTSAVEAPALATAALVGTAPAAVEAAANTSAVEAPLWLVDDILLENPRGLAEGKYSPGGADMTAYERFF